MPSDGYTPTPAISHAILTHNARGGRDGRRDRDHAVAQPARGRRLQVQPAARRAGRHRRHRQIQDAANELLRGGLRGGGAAPLRRALERDTRGTTTVAPTSAIWRRWSTWTPSRAPGIRIGVDPLGGASVAYWEAIADRYRLDLEVVNDQVDPTFAFMPVDHDGKIRMDCSSPDAMAGLIALKDRSTSPSGTTPTPTARHRHPRARGC